MKKVGLRLLPLLALLLFVTGPGFASEINFDDIAVSGYWYTQINDGYAGLHWTNFFAADATQYPVSYEGYGYAMTSAPNVAFNGGGNWSYLQSDTLFTLTSANFGAGWNDGLLIE